VIIVIVSGIDNLLISSMIFIDCQNYLVIKAWKCVKMSNMWWFKKIGWCIAYICLLRRQGKDQSVVYASQNKF